MLYSEFEKDNMITIEQRVIQDIYAQTNGYVEMVILNVKSFTKTDLLFIL